MGRSACCKEPDFGASPVAAPLNNPMYTLAGIQNDDESFLGANQTVECDNTDALLLEQ
jgi:hypothetical protein